MKVKRNQQGFVVSSELLLITTILVIGLIVGLVAIRNAVVAELHDFAEAIGNLDQSYYYTGTLDNPDTLFSSTEGSAYSDQVDDTGSTFVSAGDDSGISVSIAPTLEDTNQNPLFPQDGP